VGTNFPLPMWPNRWSSMRAVDAPAEQFERLGIA
jgi:hypothetical protein